MNVEIDQTVSIVQNLKETQKASVQLRAASKSQKDRFLEVLADALLENTAQIIAANAQDLERMEKDNPKLDRLILNEKRIQDLAQSLRDISKLADPTGQVLVDTILPNGLSLQKIAVPLGVVGVIFEARPNVTVDVTAICIKSGNAVVLKGGTDAQYSNEALVEIIHKALAICGLPEQLVCLLPAGRAYVKEMLEAVKYIDIIIPRGSDSLIQFVRKNSLVPTIETGAGVCHTYVHETANLDKAVAIVINAKTTRVSVCNSLDTIVVDKVVANDFIPKLIGEFKKFEVEIFADDYSFLILKSLAYPYLQLAEAADFGREFLSYKCSIKVVENMEEAMEHIAEYSSKHSEAIVAENEDVINRFLSEVDAAAVYSNASTRFTDGGQFGLGAEIGISTQKLHARGPFALEKLVTEKWIIKGEGQIRI